MVSTRWDGRWPSEAGAALATVASVASVASGALSRSLTFPYSTTLAAFIPGSGRMAP
ncbi:hypothetical protein ACFFX0_01810 [Citricoccus parietis]|uniref:Uncharacterized protein n=1 Tax=Citricoccus parietis TaxID=592307 RepID=A0ABV5FTI8_9MICC